MLPTMEIKAITRLIPILYYLQKLSNRNQLYTTTLSHNHGVKELFERRFASLLPQHCFSLENMTTKQQITIKSSVVDTNNCLNRIFLAFNSLNREFYP